jgi:4-aminobutyrate aminotransferase-like enzyme
MSEEKETFEEVTDKVDNIPDPEPMTEMEILRDNIGIINMRHSDLVKYVAELQETIGVALAEIQSTKQLIGHVLGRGMGSTAEGESETTED